MPFARINLSQTLAFLAFGLWLAAGMSGRAAGVTLITHGNSGNTDGWVTGMANALSQRLGGNVPVCRIDVTTNGAGGYVAFLQSAPGGNPLTTATGEIIVKLDWRTLANASHTTFSVADALAPVLAQTNFIPALGGHALAEFPLHILGHSRGGSLVCELSRRLGELGIWVDQVTTLDAYPLAGDAPVVAYENVLFAESYYQTDYLFFDGVVMSGAHWRRQTTASGGYGDLLSNWHSDVHLWYHGTIDLSPTASDTEASFTSTMRDTWWTTVEQRGTNAGFIYSRLGGGDRLSTLQPNGANSSAIRAGYNQNFDLGAGAAGNRTALLFNAGEWPNVIKFDLLTTNPVPQGANADLRIYFQWAQPASLTQTVQVFFDADRNPLNGNEQLALAGTASGTTAGQVGAGTITVPVSATNAPVGEHYVFVKLTANGRSRWLYAPTTLRVTPSLSAPVLDILPRPSGIIVAVNGVAGQMICLLASDDLLVWQPFATNTLSADRWELSLPANGTNRFYRARLLP